MKYNKLHIIAVTLISTIMISCNSKKQTSETAKPTCGIIAHRGLWKTEGSAQNSRKALQLAIDHGFYGSEFDVHLTKDNVAVVFHDNEIEGINIQNTDYADLKNLKLSNGERLPTLEQYLKIAAGQTKTKLILEVKSHNGTKRNQEAAQEAYRLVKEYKAEGITEYISFDMDACCEFMRLDPNNKVSFLCWDKDTAPSPADLKEEGFYGLDYSFVAMKDKMRWINEARQIGLATNVWTVNDRDDMRTFVQAGVNFITTDEPIMLDNVIDQQ